MKISAIALGYMSYEMEKNRGFCIHRETHLVKSGKSFLAAGFLQSKQFFYNYVQHARLDAH